MCVLKACVAVYYALTDGGFIPLLIYVYEGDAGGEDVSMVLSGGVIYYHFVGNGGGALGLFLAVNLEDDALLNTVVELYFVHADGDKALVWVI